MAACNTDDDDNDDDEEEDDYDAGDDDDDNDNDDDHDDDCKDDTQEANVWFKTGCGLSALFQRLCVIQTCFKVLG